MGHNEIFAFVVSKIHFAVVLHLASNHISAAVSLWR